MLHLAFDQAVHLWDHSHGNRRHVDINMLFMYWGLSKHSHYLPLPAPCAGTFLFEERPGGRTIAIERHDLTWNDIDRGQFVCQRGRLSVLSVKDLAAFACSVSSAICGKTERSRLRDVQADEHVLLLTSKLVGTDESTYLWAPLDLPIPEPIEHLYLIVQGRLLEFRQEDRAECRQQPAARVKSPQMI